MSYQAEVINVLIASPSDVSRQRDEIEAAIVQWNKKYTDKLKVVLLPRRWEDDVYPARGKSDAQAIINEQLVEKCDILVGVFWNKLGTPTLRDKSGTLEEISICIDNDKEVILYFVDDDVPRNVDRNELEKVDAFKTEYGKQNLYGIYDNSKIVDHLYKYVNDYLKKQITSAIENTNIQQVSESKQPIQLTKDNFIENLLIGDRLSDFEILFFAFVLETHKRKFGESAFSTDIIRSIVEWENNNKLVHILSNAGNYEIAITNLVDRSLLESSPYTTYCTMPLSVYEELRSLKTSTKEIIKAKVNSVKSPK